MSFVFNRWVRGNDFFGRAPLLRLVRDRQNRATWILGNRRVGKTSMLRQIEWLCRRDQWTGSVALYWDLQGAGNTEGLKESFIEALEDAEELADDLNLDIDELEDASFGDVMRKFRRAIKNHEAENFLLLIDECEELVEVAATDPAVLSVFRKLSHSRGCRLIMAGSMRLMDLDESNSRTSPFLPDFLPPMLLGPFEENECLELLAHNEIDDEAAREIYRLTLGNPHLVQVMGEHFQRIGDMHKVLAALERDKICHYFFKSNFLCLPESMRAWLEEGGAVSNLAQMTPDDTNLPFAVQSSLIAIRSDGSLRVSPLLEMVEGVKTPAKPVIPKAPASAQAPVAEPAPPPFPNPVPFLRRRETPLLCLSPECLGCTDPEELVEAQNPPSLSMISAMDESDARLHEILAGASPEYVMGQSADERTAVYLAGLFLFHRYLKKGAFAEIEDPWDRAGKIGDSDVPLQADLIREAEMPAKLAMVLVRALAADPNNRYQSLDAMDKDLSAI